MTASIEGAAVPGGKAPVHIMEGKEFKHPDSVGADRNYTLKVLALDRDSGKILWERAAFEGKPYDDRHKKNTYASPTPATDGRYVFAYFGSEGLYAYDFNGKLVWKKTLGQFPTFGMGTGTSPVLYENLVIIQRDSTGENDSYIVAFDKKNGKEVWHAQRKVQVSWSTPLLVGNGSRTELITRANESIIAYDPVNSLGEPVFATPAVADGRIYIRGDKHLYCIEGAS